MKKICLILMMMGCSASIDKAACARALPQLAQDQPAASAPRAMTKNQNDAGSGLPSRVDSDLNRSRAKSIATKTNSPRKVPTGAASGSSPNSANRTSPGMSAPANLNHGPSQNGASRLPNRSATGSKLQPANSVRHRGSNAAIVGGPNNAENRSSGGLNGTGMGRKP